MEPFVRITGKHIDYNLNLLPHLCFEVTEACNLSCEYCTFSRLYSKGGHREGTHMPFEVAKTIMDYLWAKWEKTGVKQIPARLNISVYGGEPLLNFPLIETIINYVESNASRINRHITFSMTTNALLLPRYIDFLVDKKFNLLISLDGDEWGDSYRINSRGEQSFHTVLHNVQEVQTRFPVYFQEHVSFNAVLNNRNSYKSIHSFFKKHFDKTPSISPLSRSNINPEEFNRFCSILNKGQTDLSCIPLQESPALYPFMNEFEMKSGNVYYDFDDLINDWKKGPTIPTGTCVPFMKKMFVTARGRILQCERIDHDYYLGQIAGTSVELEPERVADMFNQRIYSYSNRCTSCKLVHYCMKCVYLEPEAFCSHYRNKTSDTIDIKGVSSHLPEAMEFIYSSKTIRR